MARVFVTGATGNVGRAVVRELLRRRHRITALVRGDADVPGCDLVRGALPEVAAFRDAVAGADAIVHLASARSNDRGTVLSQDVEGTAGLLEAWCRGPFVFASSQTVYGTPKAELTEAHPLNPECWYDMAKVVNEAQIAWAASDASMEADYVSGLAPCLAPPAKVGVSLRLGLLFGHGPRRADGFLQPLVDECLKGTTFVFDSQEMLERAGTSFIGENDLGRAVADALGLRRGGTYNVAGRYCPWRVLIELINEHAGTSARCVVKKPSELSPGDYQLPQSVSLINSRRFEYETGFRAIESLEDVLSAFMSLNAAGAR